MENIKILENIKSSLTRLTHYEKLSNQAADAWDEDPESLDREEAFNHAYELEFHEYNYAAYLITRLTGLDEKVSRKLVVEKRAEMIEVIDKAMQKA